MRRRVPDGRRSLECGLTEAVFVSVSVGGFGSMTEQERDAIIGRAVREYAMAEREVYALQRKSERMGFCLGRLSLALKSKSAEGVVEGLRFVLRELETEGNDLTEMAPASLKAFATELNEAIKVRDERLENRRKVGV
jgi:hypothetical protein